MPRDDESVLDIVLAAELIEQYLAGVDFEEFAANSEKQSAVRVVLPPIERYLRSMAPDPPE